MVTTETSGSPVYVGGGDMGFGGGSWVWIILLFALFGFGGMGGWGGNQPATQDFVQNQANYSNLLDGNRDLANLITSGTAQAVAATNQSFHDSLAVITDKYGELQRDIAAVQVSQANSLANQNECCMNTRMAIAESNAMTNANIAQSRYDAALNTAAINENLTAQTQKVLDVLAGNRMADMQNQINQLQMQNAMSNVVRYPNAWTFNAGPFPCGCCGNYS